MKLSSLICLFLLCLSFTPSAGIDDDFITPGKILSQSYLMKDAQLVNGPNVYLNIAKLIDQVGTVEKIADGITSDDVSLVWGSNPTADKKVFNINLQRGASLLSVINEAAHQRGEFLTKTENFVVITQSPASERKVPESDVKLNPLIERLLIAVIPNAISIHEPQESDLERYLNAKLLISSKLSSIKESDSLRVAMSSEAQSKLAKINIIGKWSYLDLFEALELSVGIKWYVDGKLLRMDK